MKANELMIGDWVLLSDTPVKVDAIKRSQSLAEYGFQEGYYLIVTKNDGLSATNFPQVYQPIPLTEEILKANGIGYQYGNVWYQSVYPHEITIGSKICMEIEYVHELQHALRLCGLKELADNFKID